MRKSAIAVCMLVLINLVAFPKSTPAATDPFIGEVMMTAANFCPRGWTEANGQLLPINQNEALFALLGTMYGGDGRTTLALLDLRGRVPLHAGQGLGLTNRTQGSRGGEETHALTINEMPSHNHGAQTSNSPAAEQTPASRLVKNQDGQVGYVASGAGPLPVMAPTPTPTGPIGNGQPHNNMQPFVTVRYCIALQGVFPARN